jgi:hypothetical protein
MRSRFIRPVLLAVVVASAGIGAYMGTAPIRVLAAETHSNCATFDNNGNILSVTPNCSETFHAPPSSNSFPSPNPCTGAPGVVTLNDSHSVFHVNVDGASDVWLTGTDGGSASFDAVSGPSGSGTWTSWFGGALNNRSSVFSSTFRVAIHLSDGTLVTMHDTSHTTITATGVVMSFDKPTLHCGG